MPSSQTLFVPMPIYMRKYLVHISENRAEPVVFHDRSDYNILIGRLLQTRRPELPSPPPAMGVLIALPNQRNKDVLWTHNHMSLQSQEKFRQYVKNELFFDFRNYIREMLMDDIPRKDAIEIFFDALGISPDDVNVESFYRMYTRHLERKKKKFINLSLETIRYETSRVCERKKRRLKKYFINHSQGND